MFGAIGRKSSNVRAMQLFHELKQQFPTLPDHVVSSCIANGNQRNKNALVETLEEALAQQEPMGRIQPEDISLPSPTTETSVESETDKVLVNNLQPVDPLRVEESRQTKPGILTMNEDITKKLDFGSVKFNKKDETVETTTTESNNVGKSAFYLKRPNTLQLSNVGDRFNNIQPSGKCSDVHKLLNSELVNKPPRSPQSAKRFTNHKNSPTKSPRSPTSPSSEETKKTEPKKETADTPTQTTDTLLGVNHPGVNLSVNCSIDVQTPTKAKCTTSLQVVPQQPWCQEVTSPRSYTSVNLTLRPPSSEPQAPIDITSKNSSLTYSTSSFDPHKGLQSKLQITVGPSGGGVSSMRTRPKSSYHPEGEMQPLGPANRTGSLQDLGDNVPIIVQQQIRIEKLQIELKTEKCRLVALQEEVASLENAQQKYMVLKKEQEEVRQLEKDVKELQEECSKLTQEINRQPIPPAPVQEPRSRFYSDPYQDTSNSPVGLGFPEHITSNHPRNQPPHLQSQQSFGNDGPKWNCQLCTFQNHPLLDICEQCDCPRILHGKKDDIPRAAQRFQPTNSAGLQPNRTLHQQYSSPVLRNYDYPIPNVYSTQYSSPAVLAHPRSPRTPSVDQNSNLRNANGFPIPYPSNWPLPAARAPVVNDRVFNPYG